MVCRLLVGGFGLAYLVALVLRDAFARPRARFQS